MDQAATSFVGLCRCLRCRRQIVVVDLRAEHEAKADTDDSNQNDFWIHDFLLSLRVVRPVKRNDRVAVSDVAAPLSEIGFADVVHIDLIG